jgi:ketosteroid isomerase-like protein
MAHENEQRLRDLYDAFSRGDLDTVLSKCSDEIRFEVPGSSEVAGRYTKSGFFDLIDKVMRLSAGTFREEILDLVADDERGIVLLLHRLEREGRPVEYRTAHLWWIQDGRFSAWREHPGDQQQFDRAWS